MKHYIILLDVSDSVYDFFYKVVNALNYFIETISKLDQDIYLSICCFSNEVQYVLRYELVRNVRPFKLSDFKIGGLTSLYDSVTKIIHDFSLSPSHMENILIIVTDGADNWSRKFSKEEMEETCARYIRYGWRIIHLHANDVIDIVNNSEIIGFDKEDDLSNIFSNLSM